MKKILITLLAAIVVALLPASGVLAATSANVTVTAVPGFVGITNSPDNWTINGITGTGVINPNTTYYTNPLGDTTAPSATVVDGECRFTMTNNSSVATNITVNFPNFTGSGDTMTNSNDGTNGATTFGAYSYFSGMTYSSKVVAKATGSDALKSSLAASTNLKWGLEIKTRTNEWTSGSPMTSTVVISSTAS